jgi:2-polyprenyl-3-methyl-5-hydroxy-6-metoxy-1,4-benzoquinol methylase
VGEVMDFSRRCTQPEVIDSPDALDSAQILQMLAELRTINRVLGMKHGYVRLLSRLLLDIHNRQGGRRSLSLLDLGTGSGDLPEALLKSLSGKLRLRVAALDFNFRICRTAREWTRNQDRLSIVQADMLALPVKPGSVDVVVCSTVLHHFPEEQISRILRQAAAAARQAVVVFDLQRHPLAYAGIRLLTGLFSGSPAIRADGPRSVLKGFDRKELHRLVLQAGLPAPSIRWQWPFRYSVIISKPRPSTIPG